MAHLLLNTHLSHTLYEIRLTDIPIAWSSTLLSQFYNFDFDILLPLTSSKRKKNGKKLACLYH